MSYVPVGIDENNSLPAPARQAIAASTELGVAIDAAVAASLAGVEVGRDYAPVPYSAGSLIWPRDTNISRSVGYGSSTMAQLASALSTVMGNFDATYTDGGKGGEWYQHTEARIGSVPALLTFPGNQIPAGTDPVAVTVSNFPGGNANLRAYPGDIAGVAGSLSWSTGMGSVVFTRTTVGSEVVVAPEAPFVPSVGVAERNSITVINVGKNNMASDPADVVSRVVTSFQRIVRYHAALVKKVLILGHFVDSGTTVGQVGQRVLDANAILAQQWGPLYVDVQGYMCSPQVWTDLADLDSSFTGPTPEDLAAQARGTKPPSLSLDAAHFSPNARVLIAQKLIRPRLITLGYFSEDPPPVDPTITSDSFTGGDTANIDGRITDAALGGNGIAWNTTVNAFAIAAGKLVKGSANGQGTIPLLDKPNCECSILFETLPTAGTLHINTRRTLDGSAQYRVQVSNAGWARLRKSVGGTVSYIGAETPVAAPVRVGIRTVGDQISLVINDAVAHTVTDASVPAAGRFGISTDAAVSGFVLDDLKIDTF